MTNSPKERSPQQIDPAIIESAPVEAGSQVPAIAQIGEGEYLAYVSELVTRLEAAESDNERLRGKETIDSVRAAMMRPYADKVFLFVVGYCLAVLALIIAQGLGCISLPEMLLNIIAGSTAVSVIGLIGIVVGGLFGKTPSASVD